VAGSIGLVSAILGIGGGAGIVLAGPIVDTLSYHWLFWVPLVAVAIAAVATALLVPESPVKAPAKIAWSSAVLLSAGLAALMLAVSEAPSWGWGSARTVGLAAAGLAALAAWVRTELVSAHPLVDMRVMRLRGVWTTNLVAFLVGMGMYSSFILLPQLVELPKSSGFGFGASVTGAGLFMVPMTIMMLLVGPAAGRLERRFGSKPPLVAGAIFVAAGYGLLGVVHDARVEVTAMNTIARTVGGALGSQVVASILTGIVVAASGLPRERAFTISFALAGGAMLVSAFVALAIPGRGRARPEEQPPTHAAEAETV
jgi:MFS family permease